MRASRRSPAKLEIQLVASPRFEATRRATWFPRFAAVKARLSEHLRPVRNGGTLTVLDRDTPVARIVPYAAQPLEIRKAKRRVRDLKVPPKPAKRTDSIAVLLEDRRGR